MKTTTKTALTVDIPIYENGRKVGVKTVATYPGLLAQAHEEGLRSITTQLLQRPDNDNGDTAVVIATVVTQRGTFTGIGDANPGNVNQRMAPHIIRLAETRAKARALRDAVNIGIVCLEELADLGVEDGEGVKGQTNEPHVGAGSSSPATPATTSTTPSEGRGSGRVTRAQLGQLWALARREGMDEEAVRGRTKRRFGREPAYLSAAQADTLIDSARAFGTLVGNGNGHGGRQPGEDG